MPIDPEFVDDWSAKYDNANRATDFRLDGTRLEAELRKRFPTMYDKVGQLATLYEFEHFLFTTVHGNVARRGAYAADEFLVVGNWKSHRPIGFYVQNRAERIEERSRAAFARAGQPRDQLSEADKPWNVLDQLRGVGIPVASALLTVWHPGQFTVIDFRALHTLGAHEETPLAVDAMPYSRANEDWWKQHYDLYVRGCQAIATRVRRPLRTVDKALWRWSSENS